MNDRDRRGLLADWRWLIGQNKYPILATVAGDAFVAEQDKPGVFFLDVANSECSIVAGSRREFDDMLRDPGFVEFYFRVPFTDTVRTLHPALGPREVFSFKTHLQLGGEYRAENYEPCDVDVHFSVAGQISQQIADLPNGAVVSSLRIKLPGSSRRWWKFW